MPIWEKFSSRSQSQAVKEGSGTLEYIIAGSEDDVVVMNTLALFSPLFTVNLVRTDYSIKHIGFALWEGTATYGNPNSDDNRPHQETDTGKWTVEVGGGTQHITRSLATQKYPNSPGIPDYKRAIEVDEKGKPKGIDISAAEVKISRTYIQPAEVVTVAYIRKVAALKNKTNKATFFGFQRGELRFDNASFQERPSGDWECKYDFLFSENETDLTIESDWGNITGVDKKGHEYLWCRYVDKEFKDGGGQTIAIIPNASAAYVEQIYQEGDFADLQIGTS